MSVMEKQKIAAFGSSYRETHSSVGAAEGCDLLILLPKIGQPQLPDRVAVYPMVIKLALPPAAAVLTLKARSITRRSNAILVSPCDKP